MTSKGRSSTAATSRRHKNLRNHWYYTAATAELALSTQIVSFSRHLCSRRDARVDKPMPKERLLGKFASKIQIYLHWTKPKIFIFSRDY